MLKAYADFDDLSPTPKPKYIVSDLLSYLERSIEEIDRLFPGSLVIMRGDVNTLQNQDIVDHTGHSDS